jgi:hypothetical protein
MRWTKNPDGTYHIIATRNWVGGRQETCEYDSPTPPVTGSGAWRQGMRGHRKEHETPKQWELRQAAAAFAFLVVVIITIIMVVHH